MLKWTTRGSLNDSDSWHTQSSMVEKSTMQAYSSVITQLSKVSNPAAANVDSTDPYHCQPQGKQKSHGGSGRHSSGAFMAPTSSSGRRTFIPRLKRSSSLSRGDRSVVGGQGLRYASSRSLPSSPQTVHNAPDDTQKKTGVLGKFRKLFRTAKSVNKVYQVDTATAGKFSPGPARRRSRSPVNKEDSGNVKGASSSKTRLTRLIAAKRGERKQTRSNFSIQKSVLPHKSESISSAEEHPYVQHSQVDKTLFLQNEPNLGSDAPERTSSDLPPPRFTQNQQRHRQSAALNSTALPKNIRFSELGANVQCRQEQTACLQRSSSLRSSIDTHGSKCSKASVFDQRNPNISLQNPQRRRWSSQSTNISLRSNETECQPALRELPRSGSGLTSQLVHKQSYSDDSLFQFGESLMTMLELGSLKKVKVMPSQPDIIIQARKSLSPVYKNLPLGSPQDDAITPRTTTQDVQDKFLWSVTDDGAMLIMPTTESCKPDKINHKQSDLVTRADISWPRNNNNGRGKMYGNPNIYHIEQETSDAFFKMCTVSKEDTIHDEQRRGCAVSAEGENTELVTTEHNKMGVSYESPLSLHVGTDHKCEVSRVRVRDIVKSIEEQCEGVSKRSFPDYTHAALVFGDEPEDAEFDSHRTTDDGHGSDSTAAIPPGWIQETGQDVDNKENDICATSPVVMCRHIYSSCESEGFSPKVCFSVSEPRSSFHITFHGRAVEHEDSNMQSPNESEICDSSGGSRTFSSVSPQSSYTPSIPSDMVNDAWTLPSDVQGVISDSSNVDSLVRNIALTNKAAKSAVRASTASQSDKMCDRHNETDKSPIRKRQCKKVVRNEQLTKCANEANESECEDSTRESLTSHSQRVGACPLSPLLFTSNQEEGITDVRVPVTLILQDSSLLEAIEDSTVDVPDHQLAEESGHHRPNSSSIATTLQASLDLSPIVESTRQAPLILSPNVESTLQAPLILSPNVETNSPRSPLLTQKSPAIGHPEHANSTTSEMKQTEPMISIQSACDNSGFLQTTDFKWEQDEPDSLVHLQRDLTKPPQNQHVYEGETELPTPTGLQQGQAGLVVSTFDQGTTLNCARILREPIEPSAVLMWRAEDLVSSSSQLGNMKHCGDLPSEDSPKETNQVQEYGESLKQTNGRLDETTLLEPTQESKQAQLIQSISMFPGNVDCIHSKRLLVEPLIPSSLPCGQVEIPTPTNILSGKEESLQPTDSPDALVASPGVATGYGSRCSEGKHSPIVKPKKKVSFNLDTSQQGSTTSLSDVAVIEVAPRVKATADYQHTSTGDTTHDLGQVDTVSSTDVSCSFSLRSDDGQGLRQQATSSSGEDLTWWGPDVAEDIHFFHDEVNEKDVKDPEDKRIFDVTQQTTSLELPRRHGVVHDPGSNCSSTSLSENNVNTAGAIQSNKVIHKTSDIFTWLHNGVAESVPGANVQTITGKKSEHDKDANSTLPLNRESDKHIQEQWQQPRPGFCMQAPEEPPKYQDGSVHRPCANITNEGGHVHPAYWSISNEDENVHRTDSDITNDDRSFHRTDSNITNEEDNASLSDTNSGTYDVFGTLTKCKKVTTPWWEEPVTFATNDLGPEKVASTIEGSSKLPEQLNPPETVQGASGLSDCLPQSPLPDNTIHADDKRSEKERARTANQTPHKFDANNPSRESPDIYSKQHCQQDNPTAHGDRRTEPTTAAASVQPRSSGESKKYSGRRCMRAFSSGKRQASFIGERRPFVLSKHCDIPAELGIVKTNNDGTKTSCDGETCVFDFSSPGKGDNPVNVRTSQPGYSSKTQGSDKVAANKTRTCNTGTSKKLQPRDVSSPENATSRSNLLAGDTAQSPLRIMTKHRSVLAHNDSQPGLKHCWKPSKLKKCELGENHHTLLEVTHPPAQTSPSKSDQHVSLEASEPATVPEPKPCSADNHYTVTCQTTPYSLRNQPKSSSNENIYCLNCACDTGYDGGIDSKKGQRKNWKYKYEFGCNVQTCDSSKSDDGLPDPSLSSERLADSSSSDSENQGRQGKSSPLKQPQQQVSPNYSTCSLGTKYLCRQRFSNTGGGSSHTELGHISRPNPSTSQHSQEDWSHSSESARSYMARPAASKSRYIRKTSLSGLRSLYTNTTRSYPPKTGHCNTHWSSSPVSEHTHSGWFDVPHAQSSSTGRGDSSTTPKCGLDSQPGQWLFIATFFVFQLFLHWLYAR